MTRNVVQISSDEDEGSKEHNLIYKGISNTVELSSESLKCLNSGSYLKDNIIQFYLAYLLSEASPQIVSRVHIFDSIFVDRLEKLFSDFELDSWKYKQLRKWYEGVDIFEKDFLIFPLCQNEHWLAMIVCYPAAVRPTFSSRHQSDQNDNEDVNEQKTPALIVMDSLGAKNWKVSLKVRDFLDYEWRNHLAEVKRFSHHDLKDYNPRLPKQKNTYDCGIYMLMYIKCFLEEPDEFYDLVLQDPDSVSNLRCKIKKSIAENDRESLKSLIHKVCTISL